jgi:hypothetical protein
MRSLAVLLGLMASFYSGSAQVTVEVVLDQDQFLPAEPLVATVRLTNRSGQTLSLGSAPEWLTFSVEAREGLVVSKLGEIPAAEEFVLPSSKVASRRVNLMPCFNLTQPGRYTVTASVRIPQWDREFNSQPKAFDIIQGIKLWEQAFGVPQPASDKTGNPEVRKYALQQANYLKQLKLYARLTDAEESRVFRMLPLGTMVSFGRPEPQVDQASNLHVLFQTGARTFCYCVINPDGQIIVHQTHDYTGTRPRLRADADGKISVAGGKRRTMADDVPAAPAATRTNGASAPKL